MKKKFVFLVTLCLLMSFSLTVFAGTQWVPIPKTGDIVVDTLNKVDARYKRGNTDTGEYCCAAYAIKYYKQIYKVQIGGLSSKSSPTVTDNSGYELVKVNIPQQGDLAFWKSPHSAIVKSYSSKTKEATLIEQNWKYTDSKGVEQAAKNRVIGLDNEHRGNKVTFYRLQKKK